MHMADTTRDLKHRAQTDWAGLPTHVKYAKDDLEAGQVPDATLWSRVSIWNRHLQNLLLIEQLLKKSGHANDQDLINVAKESLDVILVICKYRDRFVDQHVDYEWIVSA